MALKELLQRIKLKSDKQNGRDSHVQSPHEKEIKELYGQKTYSIDDYELADMILESITTEQKQFEHRFDRANFRRVNMTVEQAKQIAREFFENLGGEYGERALAILEGQDPNVDIKIVDERIEARSCVNKPTPENPHMTIKLIDYRNIDTLYDLVHEITHTFDVKNFDHTTRWILGESAPSCMERLLDDYLLSMPDQKLQDNNINREDLSRDVLDRQLLDIISKVRKNAVNLQASKKSPKNINRVEESRYMIAMLVNSHFAEMDSPNKKAKLEEFIRQVENDDMQAAFKAMDMDMDRSQTIARKSYIDTLQKRIEKLVYARQCFSNDWKPVNMKLQNSKQKAFIYERTVQEKYKTHPGAPDRIIDMIIAEGGKLIGFAEMSVTPDNMAHLCTQEQITELALESRLPIGIEDSGYLTTSNDVAILIDDKHRGHRLGEKLLEAALVYLHKTGVHTLRAEDVRKQALGFYLRNGGKQVEDKTLLQPQVTFDVEQVVAQMLQRGKEQEVKPEIDK